MAAYLIDHPPRIRQFRDRGTTPSGVIVVHTAESFPDEVGPDSGAENVAAFIARRTTPGSYHGLADSDDEIVVVPFHLQAYGDGTGSNPHAYHLSAATQAAKWPKLDPEWVDATVRNMARNAARYARWLKRKHGVEIPAKRITRAQSDQRIPGFLGHGERDPGRRTDPGAAFPWETFLRYFDEELNGVKPAPREDEKPPTRGKVVDETLRRTTKAIKTLREAKANEGTPRDAQLEAALDALLEARRKIRDVKILGGGS